jgi:hypothetical protein
MNKWSWMGKPSLSGKYRKKIKEREANSDFCVVLKVTFR